MWSSPARLGALLCLLASRPLTADADADAAQRGAFCECVPFYQCDSENKIITNGANIFDVKNRIVEEVRVFDVAHEDCPKDDTDVIMKCCTIPPVPEPAQEPALEPAQDKARDKPEKRLCGTPGGSAVVGSVASERIGADAGGAGGARGGEASFGEFPWMLALLKKTDEPGVERFKCGASLIHPRVALTAAHCVADEPSAAQYTVRAGEFDTSAQNEALAHQDRDVADVRMPDNFHATALYHDTALLLLAAPFDLDDHVATLCLPAHADLFDGDLCVAIGWGRSSADGEYSSVLRKVQLSVVAAPACQAALRKSRLGRYFLLDPSFVCAQGERGADTCDGDGGSPLICPLRTDPLRFAQAGVTAWGVGCAGELPSVFANVARARRWIDARLREWGCALDDDVDVGERIDEVFNTRRGRAGIL